MTADVGAVIDRQRIPSPGGEGAPEGGGRGTAKCWTREEAWYGVLIVRLPPAFLIRHGWRRATFPSGEGIRCVAFVGASIARPPVGYRTGVTDGQWPPLRCVLVLFVGAVVLRAANS